MSQLYQCGVRMVLPLVLFCAAAAASVYAAPASVEGAVQLNLRTLDGRREVDLSEWRGRPVLVNFWASNCAPCVKELPLLASQARQWPQMPFVGVAMDQQSKAWPFAQAVGVGYVQLVASPTDTALLARFGNHLQALPFTAVLNRQHQICTVRFGALDRVWIGKAVQACTA